MDDTKNEIDNKKNEEITEEMRVNSFNLENIVLSSDSNEIRIRCAPVWKKDYISDKNLLEKDVESNLEISILLI